MPGRRSAALEVVEVLAGVLTGAGWGVGFCERMLGPATRTVSIAVNIAVCIGMLGRAETVAATIFAIYREYSLV